MKNQIRLRPIKYLLALRVPHPYLKKIPQSKESHDITGTRDDIDSIDRFVCVLHA